MARPSHWQSDRRPDVVINLTGRAQPGAATGGNPAIGVPRRRWSDRHCAAAPSVARVAAGTATIYSAPIRRSKRRAQACSAAVNRTHDTWRFSIDVATAWECAFKRPSRTDAEGCAAVGDDDEPDLWRIRHARRLARRGLAAAGHAGNCVDYEDFVAAVRWLIDPRHRNRGGLPQARAQCRVHAATREGLRCSFACEQVDARSRCRFHEDRDRANLEELPSRSGKTARERFRAQIPTGAAPHRSAARWNLLRAA